MGDQTSSSTEITVAVSVTVKVSAEWTTQSDLERHIETHQTDVLRGIERALAFRHGSGAGWIDDDREAYIGDLLGVDVNAIVEAGAH